MPAERFHLRRPVKLLSGVLVAALLLAVGGLGAPASAATSSAKVTVSLTTSGSGDLGSGEDLRVFVTLSNATNAATSAATATVSVAGTPVSSRSSLEGWFSGANKTNLATISETSAAVPAVAPGLSNGVQVDVTAASLPFRIAGVYPISVSVASGGTVLGTARSAVAWSVTAAAPVPVAIAVPLTVPAGESEFLTVSQLAAYTAPGGVLTRELGDVEGSQIAVGIDPRVIASIRILGNSAPQTAKDWLKQLQEMPNETFPLAWADADLTAPLHAGQTSVLETKTLTYAINPNLFPVTGDQTTPTATPNPGPVEPVVPTNASLVSWNYTMPLLAWPAENSVETSDLAILNQADITSLILPSTNVDVDSSISGAVAKDGNTRIAVSDSVMSGYLRTAIQSPTRAASTEAMTELATTLALVSLESGASPRPVVLTLGRDWSNADTNFERSVSTINSRPWTSATQLSSVFDGSPTQVKLVKKPEAASRIALVASLLAGEQRVVSFAPVAEDPDALTSAMRLKMLSVLSNEWTTKTWTPAAQAFLTQMDKIVNSVQVDPSSRVTAFADQTSLPVKVSNDLDQDVTVQLSVRSSTTFVSINKKYRLQSVTVEAGSQSRVQVPIQALSNVKAQIVATLFSSTGVQVGRSVTINVDVQAGWETIGTLIFAALVAALLAFGIIRNIRKRRKAQREAGAE
ncbi:MAG TPA: DUF6049 family protein [Galbitalea sp.]|jgi:hypothetical protein|nr:DUF6049 family protein [Galbitalea sp.]